VTGLFIFQEIGSRKILRVVGSQSAFRGQPSTLHLLVNFSIAKATTGPPGERLTSPSGCYAMNIGREFCNGKFLKLNFFAGVVDVNTY
jgi:hypothetical protein